MPSPHFVLLARIGLMISQDRGHESTDCTALTHLSLHIVAGFAEGFCNLQTGLVRAPMSPNITNALYTKSFGKKRDAAGKR